MARHRRHDEEMEINLIPMIDIMLILLIFFMVATTIKHTEKALPIVLPQASASVEMKVKEQLLVIGIDSSGNKYLGTESVTIDALQERLRDAAKNDPQQAIRLDADGNTPYAQIVEVVELCQFEGLRNINLHTRSVDKK